MRTEIYAARQTWATTPVVPAHDAVAPGGLTRKYFGMALLPRTDVRPAAEGSHAVWPWHRCPSWRLRTRLSFLVPVLLLLSCTPDLLFQPPDVQAVSVTGRSAILPVGDTMSLQAVVTLRGGKAATGATVRWSSANPGVASVSPEGRVKAVAVGATIISATFADGVGTFEIVVGSGGNCETVSLTLGATYGRVLASGDCTFSNGRRYDRYRVVLTSATLLVTRLASAAFVPVTFGRGTDSFTGFIGGSDFGETGTQEVDWILPAGTFDFDIAHSTTFGATEGAYQFRAMAVSSDTTACGRAVFAARGVVVNRTLTETDCLGSRGREDRISVYLTQGQVFTATMRSTVFDALLVLYADGSTFPLATNDNGGGGSDARIVYTVPNTGFYQIRPTVSTPGWGAYSLTLSW